MRSGFWENPKLIVIVLVTTLLGIVSGNFLYGPRHTYPGNLAVYNDRLQIDGQPQETWKTNMGDRIMFRCITGQKDYPIFVWTKDGKPLPRDVVKYQLIHNGNSFLEIPRTNLKSEGNYSCTVSNEFGIARKIFRLCVIAPGVKEDCPGWWYDWNFRSSPYA